MKRRTKKAVKKRPIRLVVPPIRYLQPADVVRRASRGIPVHIQLRLYGVL